MQKRTKRILIILAIVIAGGIIAGIFLRLEKGPEIQSEKVYRGNLIKTVSEIGIVKPQKTVNLAFESTGIVAEIFVEEGQAVSKSAPLLSQNAQQNVLQVEQAQASYNLVQAQVKIAQTNDLALAQTSYQQALQAYQNTQTANAQARQAAAVAYDEAKNYTQDYQEYFDEVNAEYEEDDVTKMTRDLARASLTQVQAAERQAQENLSAAQISAQQAQDAAWYTLEQARQALEKQKAVAYNWEKSSLLQQSDGARVSLEIVKLALERTVLASPLDGMVSKVLIEAGEAAVAYNPVIEIVSQDLEISVNISESEIAQVKKDQDVKITLDALPDEVFAGKVSRVNPTETIIEGVTYYALTITFTDSAKKIQSGMTADVTIMIAEKADVLITPQRAIKERDGEKYVQIEVAGELQEVPVVVGFRGDGGKIEVIQGLKEDDAVVTFIKENQNK